MQDVISLIQEFDFIEIVVFFLLLFWLGKTATSMFYYYKYDLSVLKNRTDGIEPSDTEKKRVLNSAAAMQSNIFILIVGVSLYALYRIYF